MRNYKPRYIKSWASKSSWVRKSYHRLHVLTSYILTNSKTLVLTFYRLTSVTLSDSGNIMACGMADSIIKVFIFDIAKHDVITVKDLH